MPLLSTLSQKKKTSYFLDRILSSDSVLEVGVGSGWVKNYLKQKGVLQYIGIDLIPSADIVGDIRNYEALGLKKNSFEYIIAFEVVEHVDCFKACSTLLRPGGKMFLTTPVPEMDWLLLLFETLGLNQKRTSPHTNLVDIRKVCGFSHVDVRRVAGLSQWAILTR